MTKQDADAPESLRPFADDETSLNVGGLSIENGMSLIFVSGSLDIAKDKVGLESAKTLRDAFAAVVSVLEEDGDLPEPTEAEEVKETKRVRNPFA